MKKKDKCKGCVWGRWLGLKYFCMLPRCKKVEINIKIEEGN